MCKTLSLRDKFDVFRSALVSSAEFEGVWEMPVLHVSDRVPQSLIPFDKAMKGTSTENWVHFYLDDRKFECIWNNPSAYLERMKKYAGVISPDFSLYRDMPLAMQLWNTYRSRAVGHWLSDNGVPVIPNVRWGDEQSFRFCFDGIEKGGTVAVGTHGCIQRKEDRAYFLKGLTEMTERLSPQKVIVYGRAPDALFAPCLKKEIEVYQFDCAVQLRKRKGAN